MIWLKVAY